MLRLIGSELSGRRERSLALLAGIVLACASFVVLSATAKTEQLGVHGTARLYRGRLDRPTRIAAESRSQGCVGSGANARSTRSRCLPPQSLCNAIAGFLN